MNRHYSYSRNIILIAAVAILGFALPALFCMFAGATSEGCNLFDKTVWVALEALRAVIPLADWPAVSAYLYDSSRFWQHLPQIGAALWPLLCITAGQAL
jgi:apolipoprotein N-acyltransferase